MRIKIEGLKNHADARSQFRSIETAIGQRIAIDDDLARLDRLEAIDAADQRALAASAGAAHHDHFSRGDFQGNASQDVKRAEPLVYVVKLDHGKKLFSIDCKTSVRILYEQGRFATRIERAVRRRSRIGVLGIASSHQTSVKGDVSDIPRDKRSESILNIYLVRHGEAVSERIDSARPLTRAGREQVERVADRAASQNVQVSAIFHSGILRAKQTAEIIAQRLSFNSGTRELSGLLPQDDPSIAQAELETAESPIMLVGHLPHLSRLASLLVSGQMETEVIQFVPATIVCCATDVSGWKIVWTLAP